MQTTLDGENDPQVDELDVDELHEELGDLTD